MMLKEAFLAALSVFVCYGGNYIFGQGMLERPLVVGAVTGFLFGDLRTGIMLGATLEAVFMGVVNIGGAISAEPVTATVMATVFAIIMNVDKDAAVGLAVPIGIFVAFIVMFMKNVFMNIFAPVLDRLAQRNNQKGIVYLHFGSWFIYYLVFSSISFIAVLVGAEPMKEIVTQLPANLKAGLEAAGGLLPAVGFAILMRMIWDYKLAVYYLLGFILTAYMNLPSVAVAVLGAVIVVISGLRDQEMLKLTRLKTSGVALLDDDEDRKEEEDFFA